jgi:bacterioferritin-associated ferredoxin
MYVCVCFGISDKKIIMLTQENKVSDIRSIREITSLGSQCGKCIRQAKNIIEKTIAISFEKAS